MQRTVQYTDSAHPSIQTIVSKLCPPQGTQREKFEFLFDFVKNEIPFGFPPVWDYVKASETLDYGVGYCNTKAILLQALCEAANISVRLRAGLINTQIMHYIFPRWTFPFLPDRAPHLWLEVNVDNGWHATDAYIIDDTLFTASRAFLIQSKKRMGYGLCEVNVDTTGKWNDGFIQTGAVEEDLGTWENAEAFYKSNAYRPLSWFHKLTIPVVLHISNRNIDTLRTVGNKMRGKPKNTTLVAH